MPQEKKPSVRENFVRTLENRIISGELKPGDKLPPARELGNLMGVSLTVVNAGMSELASKGFIELVPRRGSFVADYKRKGNTDTFISIMRYNGGAFSSDEVSSFLEIRMAMDPFIAQLVCDRAGDSELKELEAYIAQMEARPGDGKLSYLVTDFYHQLAIISGNTFMALLYHSTREPQAVVYRMYFDKNGSSTTVATCERLLELLKQRRAEEAKALVSAALKTAVEGPMAIV